MAKYEFGIEYYLTTYKELNDYLKFVINDDKNKQIKYIFTNGALSWNETNKGNVYDLDTEIFIVFDNDSVLRLSYNFYSLMYAKLMWVQNLSLSEKEYNNERFKLDLDVSNTRIEEYKIERFSKEYEINPSSGTSRPEGGDYFKQVVLELSNGKSLCICAEDTILDGYCNIWIEDRLSQIEENMFNDDGTANADLLREWALTHVNRKKGEEENGLIPFNVQQFNEFSLAYHHDLMSSAGLWGFMDKEENIIVEPKYLFEPIECNGLYIVCEGSGWGHYDELPKGRIWSKEMNWGLINKNFETIIPFEYDDIECISPELYDKNGEEIKNDIEYFVCRKHNDDENKFYIESEVRDSNNNLIISGYSDVDYRIECNQLVVYKERERWSSNANPGYAGIYDFILNKEIIKPNKYHDMEIIDYNLFVVSDDVENMSYGTLINEKEEIIGEEKHWNQVCHTYHDKSKYKYQASTMDKKYYAFNIKDNQIVDLLEISQEDFLNKY